MIKNDLLECKLDMLVSEAKHCIAGGQKSGPKRNGSHLEEVRELEIFQKSNQWARLM